MQPTKYAITISYRGTLFCGWQKQLGKSSGTRLSIQSVLEKTLCQITQEKINPHGSGRTDAGVHAVGQVAHFTIQNKKWNPLTLQKALNGNLPDSIRVLSVKEVESDFHSQRSAIKKQYGYYFQQGPCPLAHMGEYVWWIQKKLDLKAMKKAASYLKGKHDFKPFQASGGFTKTTERQLFEVKVFKEKILFPAHVQKEFYLVKIQLVGSGFLKQMVRSIAGTLVQVGEQKRDPKSIKHILEAKERKWVGPTAPSRGLWLEKVWYPE